MSNDDNGNAIDGLYKFVFVSGAYDNDGGSIVGSEVIVSNLALTTQEETPKHRLHPQPYRLRSPRQFRLGVAHWAV